MALKTIKNNQKFKLTSDFGKYNDVVLGFIKKLYTNSVTLYERRYPESRQTNTRELDKQKIRESINYVIDYLHYYYRFYPNDFYDICLCIFQNLEYVTVLAPRERGIYGKYELAEKCLYINPQMSGSINLSRDERTRLYVNHELGHIINSKWMWFIEQYLNITPMNKTINKQLIYDGFSLLDEAITQNRAEDITYYYAGKKRPSKRMYQSRLFNKQCYQTNYDYYGELQIPTIKFARTLRGIGSIVSDDLVLQELCARALRYDFSADIIDEFEVDNQIHNLYILFQNLGIIKNASYAAFGMGEQKYLNKSKEALDEVTRLSIALRDSRPPLPKTVIK